DRTSDDVGRVARDPRTAVRRRLQPGAVAGGGLGRGRAPDAGGGRQRRQPGDLQLGAARAAGGDLGVRLAGPRRRGAARRGGGGRPGHRHGVPAAVVLPRPPREPAGDRGRQAAVVGEPAGVLPQLHGLPRRRRAAGGGDRRALRGAPGRAHVARQQRVRLPRLALLLRHQRRRLPHLAARAVRRPRCAERRVGDGLLEPALRRLGGGPAAARLTDLAQPHPAAGLVALQLGRAAGAVPLGARRGAGAQRPADHHELHGLALQAPGLLRLGPGGRSRLQRPLRHRRGPRAGGGARAVGRPHPRARPAGAVAAHGELHQRGQLAAAQPGQDAGTAPSPRAQPRRPGRRRDHVLPVAGLPRRSGEVPLGDGAARRDRHQGVARGRRPGRRAGGPGRRGGHPGGRLGRAALGLRGVVGRRAGQPPHGGRHLPGSPAAGVRGPVAQGGDRRRRAPRGRPRAVRPAPRAEPVPAHRRRGRGPRRARPRRWIAGRRALQRDRRRERPRAPRGLSGCPARGPGRAGRGVLPAGRRAGARPVRRRSGTHLVRAAAPGRGRGGADVGRRAAARDAGRHPAPARRRHGLVRRDDAGRRLARRAARGRARTGGDHPGRRRAGGGRGRPPRGPAVRAQPHLGGGDRLRRARPGWRRCRGRGGM
ncbi:MAG: GH42, partial [uncultured Frankineae bacterium]